MSHVLGQKLTDKLAPEAAEANRLNALLEQAIELTRTLARGLHPMESHTGQLTDSFHELAASKSKHHPVDCRFECHPALSLLDATVATHLFRIAQEATVNAIRHGHAKHITIGLDHAGGKIALTITDDGTGLPENARKGEGMGLRLMAYRADLMGATFNAERLTPQGTRINCTLPAGVGTTENHVKKN